MNKLDAFREPETTLDLPKELEDNKYEVFSCLKLDDGYAAYLLSAVGSGRRLLLKRATDPVISLGLANEKKLLDVIHASNGSEFADTFPSAGFFRTDGEVSWYTRDYINGRTLAELVEQRAEAPSLPRNQALGYVIQVTELLSFLHSLEPPIIHRDIKPQNVVVDDSGVCHLIDMGISRIWSEQKDEDTVIMGTRGTMPPEQFGYQQTDRRSDLYSVGVLLLYCLSGDYNVTDSNLKKIDGDIAEIIRKATQFDPNMRYQSAQELMDALLTARYGGIAAGTSGKTKKSGVIIAVLAVVVAALCLSAYPAIRLFSARAAEKARDELLAAQREIYEFKEPLIEAAVRFSIQKEEGDITLEDLKNVTFVAVFGKQPFHVFDHVVHDEDSNRPVLMEGSYWATGLFLERGDITSLEDLKYMPNLEMVSIWNQELSDISILSELPNLTDVKFGDCPITDFSAFKDAENMWSVTLNNVDIDDISVFATMPKLHELVLSYTNVTDISPLKDCSLQGLSLLGCKIESLEPVSKMSSLYYVAVPYDANTIESMYGCPAMVMQFNYDGDVTLEGFDRFPYLESLTIGCESDRKCRLYIPEDLEMPKITYLQFGGANLILDDFSALKAFPRLNDLYFIFVDIQGLDGLDELPLLRLIHCTDETKGAINAIYPDNDWEIQNW